MLKIDSNHGGAKRVLQTIKGGGVKMHYKQQLVNIFNGIARGDNEIDAVFVTDSQDNPEPILIKSDSNDENRTIDIGFLATHASRFADLLKRMKPAKTGEFKFAIFQFSEGITNITCLGKQRQVFLFFVSVAVEGIGELEFYRKRHLPQIEELLKEAGFID